MMEKTIIPNLQRLKTDTRIRDYLAMILRRKMVFMVSLASVVLSSVFYVSQIRDVYESFSTIVIEEKNYAINQAMNLNSGRSLDFYQGILGSRTFSEMLVDSIGLNVFKVIDPKLDP